MTSEARTPGVSPAEEAIDKALLELSCERHICDQFCVTRGRRMERWLILETLWRAAQVEALESVAKEECGGCKREGHPHHPPNRIKPGPDDWWHENAIRCHAGRIWDALLRLRQSASASKETE